MNDARSPAETPSPIRPGRPTGAGIYDYMIGGTHYSEADREAAERALRIAPAAKHASEENRRFLQRAVAYLARQGIDQYLDIGSGFPIGRQVHEIVVDVVPHARVVYVDRDPAVVERSRELLRDRDNVTAIVGDVRRPWDIIDDPAVGRFIDWSRPVAVQLVSVLHFISDEHDPYEIVATFRDRMSPGSHLVLSHGTTVEDVDLEAAVRKEWDTTRSSVRLRPPNEIERFFAGFDLVGPAWSPPSNGARRRPNPASNMATCSAPSARSCEGRDSQSPSVSVPGAQAWRFNSGYVGCAIVYGV